MSLHSIATKDVGETAVSDKVSSVRKKNGSNVGESTGWEVVCSTPEKKLSVAGRLQIHRGGVSGITCFLFFGKL